MDEFGFVRVSAVSTPTSVGNPTANRQAIEKALSEHTDSDIVLFAELSMTGYTCGDLFAQQTLLDETIRELQKLAYATSASRQLVVVGAPIRHNGKLYNCAVVMQCGEIVGIVPKQYLPNYQEFYEARWFQPGVDCIDQVVRLSDDRRLDRNGSEQSEIAEGHIPFGIDLLFESGDCVVGIEICEDLWMPVPPSSFQAMAGANVLLNLSASNETIGKAAWRKQLVSSQSGRCVAAYAYSSSGPTESTTDLVFSGHCLIAENGVVLGESSRVGDGSPVPVAGSSATADVDLEKLAHDRQVTGTFFQGSRWLPFDFRKISTPWRTASRPAIRFVSGSPFVPSESSELHERCAEILGIQCAGLAKRISRLQPDTSLAIGVSGGLDSTLALLVACQTLKESGGSPTRIRGLTMPGFGTTGQTLKSATRLMELLGITCEQIDIRELCLSTFRSLGHSPLGIKLDGLDVATLQTKLQELPLDARNDLTFENVQARIRTLLLMSRGFVLGTGDMSEGALGWSTYNGDHMSMYNVNTSIPKTLVRFLIDYFAEHQFDGEIRSILQEISKMPISPELLPPTADGKIQQSTEATVGAYELHDFFLYNTVRNGFGPKKILMLAKLATFRRKYSSAEIKQTLVTFYKRFFANQFKRSCVPDGPKVGSVSLSPRGDWRMPSDADVQAWLESIDG